MTSPTYTAATAPDRDGLAAAVFTGLTPGTRYWWAVELDGTLETGHLGTFRTLPAPGEPTSFSFAAASCADTNSNADSFADAAARTGPTGEPALFTVHLGDMHYQDIGTDDPAWALAAWLNALGQPNQAALYAAAPLAYTWSDHDFGGSNVAADSPAAAAVQAVYRRLVPSHPLPGDGAGIYQSWQVGRVLFVMTDGRSYASPITAPDTATKTKLGAAQKAWLKDQFAAPGVGLVIWCHEDAWHNASTFTGDDTWSAYATERAELAAYIQANDVPLLYVHGDVHALSHDDGSHVPGRFPLISVSPWDQTTFIGNGALTSGFYPDPVSTTVKSQQYGWFDVLDNGTQIVVRALGIADGQVVLRTEMSWGITRHLGWGIPCDRAEVRCPMTPPSASSRAFWLTSAPTSATTSPRSTPAWTRSSCGTCTPPTGPPSNSGWRGWNARPRPRAQPRAPRSTAASAPCSPRSWPGSCSPCC
ncbi:alkaline phosphatase D family protein [Actinomadura yumaensis]|uniref:alkaline phosphatase D family protein n=1 Tax=Actinomadura yumaensis TaxID=111807 RepID=UPI003614AB40